MNEIILTSYVTTVHSRYLRLSSPTYMHLIPYLCAANPYFCHWKALDLNCGIDLCDSC